MTKSLFFIFILFLASCSTKTLDVPKTEPFNFTLLYNGPDTVYTAIDDSTYKLCLLPIINNLSSDTVTLIRSIYGRSSRSDTFNIYPKFGINIYQDGKIVDFSFMKTCGNYGFLNPDDFITVDPNKPFLPFHDSYFSHPNFDVTLSLQLPVRGTIEIEAYYNTIDTTQQLYHPFTDKEMKMKLATEEYITCRPLFNKLAHINLKSTRIKVFLK